MTECMCPHQDAREPFHDRECPAYDPAIKTEPFEHQQLIYEKQRNSRHFALLWEMGLGKTKTIIDVASHLHLCRKIDALLIVAPNSVYSNWTLHEIPRHMATAHHAYRFRTSEKRYEHRLKRAMILDPTSTLFTERLRVVAMSYDSLLTDHGMEFAQRLVLLHRTMIVADESTAIKSSKTIRAKRMKELGAHCHYRWIATGTPVAQSPFDIHSQIEFLDPEYWKRYGLRSLAAFKNEFGMFEQRRYGNRRVDERIGYQKLDKLQKLIEPVSSRLLKEDSVVKLPPKLYSLRSFELTKKQRQVYEDLRRELIAEIDSDPASFVEAPLAITRMTRLQQICSGFVMATLTYGVVEEELTLEGSGEVIRPVFSKNEIVDVVPPEENPRLQTLLEIIEECQHKVIVWCRFVHDVDLIVDALKMQCVRYDGRVSNKDRERALEDFNSPGGPRIFVANVHAISMGVTLNIAKTAIYYTNSYSLEKRLQSEDRFHRIGQDQSVHIIDLVAEGTVDERVTESLRAKFDIAAQVTGDRLREWITVAADSEEVY